MLASQADDVPVNRDHRLRRTAQDADGVPGPLREIRIGVPVLGGSDHPIVDAAEGLQTAERLGFPIILKAAHGGGGRGMRVVNDPKDFADSYESARRESLTAFGSPDIFVEKFIQRAQELNQTSRRTGDFRKIKRLLVKLVIYLVAIGALGFVSIYFEIPVLAPLFRRILSFLAAYLPI